MDIFKLFFDHDLRLDKLAKRNANKTEEEIEASLHDFTTPTPTYSKFYLTGTRLDQENFGINRLNHWEQIRDKFEATFDLHYYLGADRSYRTLSQALECSDIGDAIVITEAESIEQDISNLNVDDESNVGHFKEELSQVLLDKHLVLYKEKAHDGFDLHLFSRVNIYPKLFHAFKPLVGPSLRFFSINSKRMGSERHFYFETWTLDKPPHGAEEVLPQTAL